MSEQYEPLFMNIDNEANGYKKGNRVSKTEFINV